DDQTLAARVVAQGPLPAATALRYIRQVGAALAYLHAKHVRHRDIKPANIMLDAQDQPVLIDFGTARPVISAPALAQTTVVATLLFAAPEQVIRHEPEGDYTDIFALAATCCYLLTGRARALPPAAL